VLPVFHGRTVGACAKFYLLMDSNNTLFEGFFRENFIGHHFLGICCPEGYRTSRSYGNPDFFDLIILPAEPNAAIQNRQSHALGSHNPFEAGGMIRTTDRDIKPSYDLRCFVNT
jgi:hypothetical protein